MSTNTSHHELSLFCGDVAVFAVTAVKAKLPGHQNMFSRTLHALFMGEAVMRLKSRCEFD